MILMNEVLKRFLDNLLIVYLDDILIFSKTKEEHLEHIRQVLQRLKEEIVYLRFVILADGLKMDLEKIKTILEWPTLENVGEVRSFHGLASFYKKFIRNLSYVCNVMFETLKQKVVELPVIGFA